MDGSAPRDAPLVLVADDDEDILTLVAFGLGKDGYRVVTALDGERALAVALEQLPDLAVLDVMMPKLTGLEVTERIRASRGGSRMPILLLTARVQEADAVSGLATGADDYVEKPFSPQELRSRIAALLSSASTRTSRNESHDSLH